MTLADPTRLKAPKRVRMESVTTVAGKIIPKELGPWIERETIKADQALVRAGEPFAEMTLDEVREAHKIGSIGAGSTRDSAARRGVNVHALLEAYGRDGSWADPVGILDVEDFGFAHALNDWLRVTRPEPVEIEQLVCDPESKYAGRFDLLSREDGQLVLTDAATSENAAIWPQKHYQLRMYERARRINGGEPADRLRIVVFCKDKTWREMDCIATDRAVIDALGHHRGLKPVEQACNYANRAEKDARRDDPPAPKRDRRKVDPDPKDPSTMPGALQVSMRRELPDGGLIEYEFAPRGWVTKDGYARMADWRAYFWTPPVQATLDVAA